jgi:pimeloyl-ACP methyl ester carboxylesterase
VRVVESAEERYRDAEDALWRAYGAAPRERWVDLPRLGRRVRVLVVGEGNPVLFVHGASNSGTSWAPLAAQLKGYQCLLLDRPGCGLSERVPRRFDDVGAFGSFAETMVVDVLDALRIDRAHLVGTSLGGYHVLRTAAARPHRVRSVTEIGWTVGAPIGATPVIMRIAAVPALGRLLTGLRINERMARSMLAQIGLRQAIADDRLPREVISWWRAQINDTDTMRNEIDASPPILRVRGGMNESILLPDDVLRRITVPTLFIWGADDPFGGEDVARTFAPRVPGARLEIVPGGHAVWMDDAARVADLLSGFLQEQSPAHEGAEARGDG